MVVMTPREKWTDERLDELKKSVDDGFARVDGEIKDLRREMDERFDKVDARFDKVDERFDKIEDRFHALNRALMGVAGVIIAALIGLNAF
ncbi:MAG TPA: hypothetical protein VFJ76_00880 [Solirubrobacterales bacterium]|nr:hypothetical protein [Solirubrobacterales bacterium]